METIEVGAVMVHAGPHQPCEADAECRTRTEVGVWDGERQRFVCSEHMPAVQFALSLSR